MLLPKPPLAQADEASTVKQELEKCYKRIADLETRVHDLTLQTTVVSWHGNVPPMKEMFIVVTLCCTTGLALVSYPSAREKDLLNIDV